MKKILILGALIAAFVFATGCSSVAELLDGPRVVVTQQDIPVKVKGGTFVSQEDYLNIIKGTGQVKADTKGLEGMYYLSPRVIDIDADGIVHLKTPASLTVPVKK